MALQGDDSGAVYLPNRERAHIEDGKLIGYLLNLMHTDGGPKARFFLSHGYRVDRPDVLRADLLTHGYTYTVATTRHTPHGMRYTVSGTLTTLDGRTHLVRTVWQIDTGTDFPRLIMAHPDD